MTSSPQRVSLSRRTSSQQGEQLIEELEALSHALYQSHRKPFPPQKSQVPQPQDTLSPSPKKKQSFMARRESLPARRFSSYEPNKDGSAIPLPGLAAHDNQKPSAPTSRPRFPSSTLTSQPLPAATEEKSEIRTRLDRRFSSPQPQRNKYSSSASLSDEHDWLEDASEVGSKLDSSSAEKKKSIWNWKPLRALSHIGRQRFHCVFSAYVHAIKGLPPAMNGLRLCVHMRKEETKEGAVQTIPSRVFQGVAEFDETLFIKCTLYGSKGPSNTTKFMPKAFVVSVLATDVEELDLGKHQLDLSRLLPDLSDDRKGEMDKGSSWDTTLDLSGKAKGGKLIVTFNYEVLDKDSAGSVNSRYRSSPQRRSSMQTSYSLPNSAHGTPRTKTRSHSIHSPSVSEPGNDYDEDLAMEQFNLDDPSHFEARNSEAGGQQPSDAQLVSTTGHSPYGHPTFSSDSQIGFANSDGSQPVNQEPLAITSEQTVNNVDGSSGHDHVPEEDDAAFDNEQEFTVVDQGMEIDKSMESSLKAGDSLSETSIVEEKVIRELQHESTHNESEAKEETKRDLEVHLESSDVVETKEIVTYQMVMKTLDSLLEGTSAKEQAHKEILEGFSEFGLSTDENSRSKDARGLTAEALQRKGHPGHPENLDNEVDLVAGEFLHMLESGDNVDNNELDSPRAQLLKQFEQEALLEGGFGLDLNAPEVPKLSLDDARDDPLPKGNATSSNVDPNSRRLSFASTLKKPSVKLSEDSKVEKAFVPPSMHTFKPQEPLPLGKGLGSAVPVKDGGTLRSMNPLHFESNKHGGKLVMQVSKPVVLPAEMGAGTVDILRNMASMGIENMALQAMTAMPLEDITGMSLEKISLEALADRKSSRNRRLLQGYSGLKRLTKESSLSTQKLGSLSTDKVDEGVSLEDLAPVAMLQVEALAMDGLKIQSHMTEEEAPYALNAFLVESGDSGQRQNKVGTLKGVTGVHLLKGAKVPAETSGDVKGLMDMAISLDEWMILDAGLYSQTEDSKAIMAAHHGVHDVNKEGKKGQDSKSKNPRWGCMGNTLTISMLVQLRDPSRSFEAVGVPMIAIVQAERTALPLKMNDDQGTFDQMEPHFRLTGVHMAGFKASKDNRRPAWGSQKQLQAGSRWLIANGVSKSMKGEPFKSATPAPASGKMKGKHVDSLWSISAQVHGSGNKWKDLMKLNPHIRNPDVIYDNQASRAIR